MPDKDKKRESYKGMKVSENAIIRNLVFNVCMDSAILFFSSHRFTDCFVSSRNLLLKLIASPMDSHRYRIGIGDPGDSELAKQPVFCCIQTQLFVILAKEESHSCQDYSGLDRTSSARLNEISPCVG